MEPYQRLLRFCFSFPSSPGGDVPVDSAISWPGSVHRTAGSLSSNLRSKASFALPILIQNRIAPSNCSGTLSTACARLGTLRLVCTCLAVVFANCWKLAAVASLNRTGRNRRRKSELFLFPGSADRWSPHPSDCPRRKAWWVSDTRFPGCRIAGRHRATPTGSYSWSPAISLTTGCWGHSGSYRPVRRRLDRPCNCAAPSVDRCRARPSIGATSVSWSVAASVSSFDCSCCHFASRTKKTTMPMAMKAPRVLPKGDLQGVDGGRAHQTHRIYVTTLTRTGNNTSVGC